MAQSIITKFISPTNTRGSRVKATCWIGSVTVSYDYALNGSENHKAAALALIARLHGASWNIIASGATPDGTGYAFIIQ